jgi:excisionase family DNA binding protein
MNLITIKQAAEKLGVSTRQVDRWVSGDESFPTKRKPYGRRSYFIESEVDQWLENAISLNAKSS